MLRKDAVEVCLRLAEMDVVRKCFFLRRSYAKVNAICWWIWRTEPRQLCNDALYDVSVSVMNICYAIYSHRM